MSAAPSESSSFDEVQDNKNTLGKDIIPSPPDADSSSSLPDSGIGTSSDPVGPVLDRDLEETEPKDVEIGDIVTMGEILVYSSEDLRRIGETQESAKAWPPFLDEAYKNGRGHWDPDRWHQNRKRGSSPPLVSGQDKERSYSSLSAEWKTIIPRRDAKDRIKTEQDNGGIVLSPQRRSFLTGCQVTQATSSGGIKPSEGEEEGGGGRLNRGSGKDEFSLRPEKAGTTIQRRVGSGRILNRNEEEFGGDRRFGGTDRYGFNNERRRNVNSRDPREIRDPREHRGDIREARTGYDRRGGDRGSFDNRRGGYNDRYSKKSEADNEPEWMNASIDQGEMMELRGFDESPQKVESKERDDAEFAHKDKCNVEQTRLENDQDGFDINQFLNMEKIPELGNLLNEPSESTPLESSQQQSRFSKFFQQSQQIGRSQKPEAEARRSSIQDELAINQSNVIGMRGITDQPNIKIPSPTGEGNPFYFAPISPAAKTGVRPSQHQQPPPRHPDPGSNALMDFILRQSESQNRNEPLAPSLNQLQGKDVKSVEELEANFRHLSGLSASGCEQDQGDCINLQQMMQQQRSSNQQHGEQSTQSQDSDGDLSAFKRFAASMIPNSQHPHHEHVLPKFNPAQQPKQNFLPGVVKPSPIPANAPSNHNIHGMLSSNARPKFSGYSNVNRPTHLNMPQQPEQPDLLDLIWKAPFNIDVLQRQEAYNLMHAVEKGDASPNSLLQQLMHGNLPELQKEILLNVLKVQQSKGLLPKSSIPQSHSQRISPMQEKIPSQNLQILQQQQQQQHHQRISPGNMFPPQSNINNLSVSPTTGHQRIPSPHELVYHTQQIMQNALIKRKLEEQKKNFHKRQEGNVIQQPLLKPGDNEEPESSTPSSLNFTPTVVMKKLAVERRDSDPRPQVPELRVNQMLGRELSHATENLDMQQNFPQRSSPISPGNVRVPNIGGLTPNMMQPVPLPPPNPLFMIPNQHQAALQHAQAMHLAAAARAAGHIPEHQMMASMRDVHRSQLNPALMQQQQQQQMGGLSRFFSPEVIAQAQAGNAPTMPPLPTQKAMTLEELERQAATVTL